MSHSAIDTTVVVATRNRGARVLDTLASILRNPSPNVEVILIDQSVDDATQQAVQSLLGDTRLSYCASTSVGAGRARNIAFLSSHGEFLLVTDDDCTVPADWIASVTAAFQVHPRIGMVFTNVLPGQHDGSRGVIPSHRYQCTRIIRSLAGYSRSIGMGAGMAIRRCVLSEVGLLDDNLGPGSILLSGEDHDYAIRVLTAGWWILEAANINVTHHGFRTFEEFRLLTRRDWVAIGAVHAKNFKCRNWSVAPLALYNVLVRGLWQPLSMISRGRRPRGFRRFLYWWEGFWLGWRMPVSCERLLFLAGPSSG